MGILQGSWFIGNRWSPATAWCAKKAVNWAERSILRLVALNAQAWLGDAP